MNKIAVITGANRGLGKGTAEALARLGYHVILTSRDREKGALATAELKSRGLDVEFFQLDVADSIQVQSLAFYIEDRFGSLDTLVNNAGIFIDSDGPQKMASIFQTRTETILKTFETNTLAPLLLTKALVGLMRKKGSGCIVNVSSGMGQLNGMGSGYPAYRISKTALNAVTRIFAEELKDTKIKVNAVCPGWVKTDMGGAEATRSLEEGITGIIWAATLSDEGPSGGFFRDGKALPW